MSDYDEMTPYELSVATKVFQIKQDQETELRVTLTWLGEYFHRQKKLMPLHEALGKEKPKPKVMTDQEMLEQIKLINAKFGGETVT